MYEHNDLVDDTFPKPADKPTPSHLAGAYEDKENALPIRPETGAGATLAPEQDAAKKTAQEWWYNQQYKKRMQGKK
jgi:hypothetical protein